MKLPRSVDIDLNALQHNFAQIKQCAKANPIIAVIKSNAYGHGLIRCAKTLTEADAFGISGIEEAVALRRAGIKQTIIFMNGVIFRENLTLLDELDCELVIYNRQQLEWLCHTPTKKPLTIWLKLNTGLNRFGFDPSEFEQVYEQLLRCSHIKQPINLMTHIAWKDSHYHQSIQKQFGQFDYCVKGLPGKKSMAKSGMIFSNQLCADDWLRPGIVLYGVSPYAKQYGSDFNLKPVMHVCSRIIAVRWQKKGDRLGYNGAWICDEAMPVGIVAIGYGHGYPLVPASMPLPVLIGNTICTTVGIAMDVIWIDLRPQPAAKVGDSVTLWGPGLPVEQVASHVKTSPYELLTRIKGSTVIPI
ncbi:MAG: alanine racemase [Pseudomonadota bacterium]